MRDLLSKLDSILNENKELDAIKNHPEADDPRIKKAIADKEKEEAGEESQEESIYPAVGDEFGLSFSEDFEIGTTITDMLEDGFVIDLDETAIEYLQQNGISFLEGEIVEGEQHGNSKIYDKCWKGYKKVPGKARGEKGSCVKEEQQDPNLSKAYRMGNAAFKAGNKDALKTIPQQYKAMWVKGWEDGERFAKEGVSEAEYQGRKVQLGKPTQGDVKKFKVYVRNPKGNVVKVNFGDKDMKIKKSNPARRKSFRARHNCDNPGPRHKARYWSCKAW